MKPRLFSRSAALVAVPALALSFAACGGDDGPDEEQTTTSASGAAQSLADDELIAVCLTDQEELNDEGFPKIATDLCSVTLDGDRSVIREGVDAGVRVALSPDRTRIAFIEEGRLHLIGIDGSDETDSGVTGSAPEWIDNDHVGLLTADRAIASVDANSFESETYLDDTTISGLMPGAFIDGFAVSASGDDVLFTLVEKPERDSGGFDAERGDRSGMGHFDTTSQTADLLLGSSGVPLGDPEFGPEDQFLVSRDNDIYRGVLGSTETTLISPEQWTGVTPTWSRDGSKIVWLANSVGRPEGPAVLMYVTAAEPTAPGSPISIIGNQDGALNQLPAFPDW